MVSAEIHQLAEDLMAFQSGDAAIKPEQARMGAKYRGFDGCEWTLRGAGTDPGIERLTMTFVRHSCAGRMRVTALGEELAHWHFLRPPVTA